MAKKDKEKEKKNISQAEESDAKIRQQRKADFTAAKRATEPTSIQKKVRKTAAKAAAEGLSEHILSGNALREKKKTNAAAPDPTFGTGTVRVKASKDGTKAELDMPKKAVSSWVKSDAAKRGGQKLASEPMSAEEKKLRQRLSSAAASAAREDADRLLTKSFRDRMNKTAKAVPDPTFGTNMFSDKISDTGVKNYVQGEAERENEKFRRKLSSAAASAAKERADRLLTKNFRDRMENIPLQNTLDPTFGTNMLSDKISDTGVKNYIQSEAEKRRIAEIENERQRARKANLKDIAFNSAKRGFIQSRYGQECFKEMMGQKNNKKYYEDLLKSYDYNFEPDKWYEKAISGAMELVGQQARQWTDTKTITGAATAATMAAAAGQMGPQVAFPEEIVTVPAAFATGMTVGSTSANFEIEAGLAYNEMVENGVSANTARRIALAVGTGNAALEALQIDDLLKSVNILNKSAVTKPTAKKIAKYLSERGAHIASETAQEVMQEGVTATGANIGSRIEKGKWEYSAGDVAQRLGETALSSALSFGAAGFGGDIVNAGKSRLLGTGINSAEGQAQNSEPIHEKQGNEKAFTQSAEENARKYTQTEKQTEQSAPPPKNAQRAQSAEDIITTIKKDPGEGGVRLALLRSGFTGADDAVLARDIIDFARGKKLTDGQRRRMSTNDSVMRVTEAIAASPETMEAIRNRYAEAQSRAETVRGENKTGEKYKIDYTTDNRPVVVVENDFLKGVDPKDYARETKKVLSGFKPGIPVKGRFVTVSRSSVMEYLHSKYSDNINKRAFDVYADKMRLAKNIDEVINASTDYVNEPNNHSRTDDIKEFARGNVLFEAGENQYSADVIIAQTKDGGMKLYDVVNIEKANFTNKKKDSSNTGSAQESALPNRPELSFNNSVAQNSGAVKGENLTNEGGAQRLDPRTPIEDIRRTMGEDAAMTELFRRESGLFQTAGRNGDDFETLFSQAPLRMVDRRAAETAYRAGIKDRFYAAGENGESFESVRGFAPERMQAAAAEAYQKGLDSRARNAEQIYSGETREGGGYGRADASGKQPGLVWNEEAQQLTPQERKNIAALARKLGKRVYIQTGLVTDDGRPALGKINDAAIYADPSRGTLVQDIIVHEFSHRMKQLSPDSWQKYADYAINDLKKTGRYDGIYSEFTKHYDGMAESEIHEEMAADYAYKMFDSEESLTELIRQDKPLAEKIKDVWFALLEKLGRDVTLKRAKNMWKMCLTEAGKTAERGGNQSGTKYKIAYTTDNQPVVVVEEDFLKGIDPKDYIKETKKKLAEFSPGIQINGRFIAVNKTTRGEFTFSKNSRHLKGISPDVHSDKMRIAENIDDAVKASTDYVGEAPKHERKDNIKEFARGSLLVQVGKNQYDADVVVGWTGEQMVLYDIVKMKRTSFDIKKEAPSSKTGTTQNTTLPSSGGMLPNDSVTQPGGVVKGGNSSNQGKNSGGTKYMLNPNFNKAVDNWYKNLKQKTGVTLLVGETSEALMNIGVKKQKIYWDTTKINMTLNKHTDINIDVIKSVPYLLENPVLITRTKDPKNRQGNNRISLYGDLYNRDGLPVAVFLELEPDNGKFILDEIKIVSTYAKSDASNPSSMEGTQRQLNSQQIISNNKKRTAGWLARTGLQLPFLPADSGSEYRIPYKDKIVKGENSSNQGKNMLPFEGGQREFTRTEERHAGQRAYKPTDTMTAREWQTERRNGNTVDAASLREIADIVRNDFGIPVSKEHFENENVTGIFNEMPETIRTAVTNDIVTVAHEVGHLLDRKLGLEDSPHLQQAFDMIDRDFAMNYSGKEIKGEAVSEFIRTYIKNKDEAKAAAPDFYEDFESRIKGTEYEKPLARLADSVNAYLSAGATERINLALAPEESKKTALKRAAENKAKMGEVFARLQNDWVDSFYGIKRAETLLQVKEKGKYSPYVLATNSRNAASKAAYILTQKFVDHEGNEIGDSFIDCLNPLNSKNRKQRESNLSELNRYLILKHALEWIEPQNGAKQKRVFADPTLENPDVIRSEIARIEQNVPQVREAAERIYEYQRNLMQIYGVESGGISQQTADDLRKKYPCYVPFIRQSEKKKTMRARSTIANQRAPVMHAFGGGELIVNPLESIIGKTESYVKFAARNSAMRALTDIADSVPGSGFVIEKLGGDMLRHVQTTDNADARLSEAKNRLNTAEGIPQEFNGIEDVGSWESLIKRGTEYVSVMKDGKKQYYQVHDKELLRSIADMSPNQLNGFLKFSRMILNIRKLFITQLSYLFSTTNPARDSKTAWNNMNINNPAQFVGEYFSALASVIKKDESYRRWCAMGGGQSSELSANIDEISRSMSKAMNGRLRYAIENPTKIFSEIFGAVADLNDIMESTPRLMAFKNEMKRSGDVQQAIYEADDVTSNFKRMGIKGRAANSMFMFANAQIQGLDRGIRSFTDASAGERTARIAKYVIGAMLMAALKQWWNREKDEDGYNKLSNYMKNAHTIIALGKGSFLRIPNAREQSLASAALDRAMDYFKGDKEAFDGFIGFAVDNLMPPFIPVPTDINGKSATDIFTDCILEAARNTMFGTATDFMANKNFTGSPIVPEAYSDLPPEQQYNERTTKPAIWLGKKLKDSPMRLDYIINNNLGVFGNINKALLPNDDAQRDKTLGFKNRWTADAYYSTDILNREYEAKDAADMELKRSNTPKNAEDYYGKLEKTTYISQMNGAINEMPQDEKRSARKRLLDVVTGWSAADAEVSDELRRLYKKTGENRFWQTPDRTFNVNGEEISLSPKKYERFALEARENFDKNAAELINSKLYKSLNDAEKAEAMQSVREYTVAAGRKDADRNYSLEKWQAGVYSGDISLNDSISEKVTKKRTEAAKERKRAEISIDTKNATGYTKEQAERLTSEAAQYYANKEQDKNYVGTNTYAHMEKYENTLKKYMPLNDYLQIRTGYYAYKESIGKRDKSSLKKQELTAYINSCTDSREVRRALFDALPHGGSKNPY